MKRATELRGLRGLRPWAVAPLLLAAAVAGALKGTAGAPDAAPAPAAAAPAVAVSVAATPVAAADSAAPEEMLAVVPVAHAGGALSAAAVREAEAAVRAAAARGAFPGAALAIGRGGEAVLERGIGRVAPGGAEVDPLRTRYDVASLTKVVATTTAVMLLVEDGRMELDAPVSRWLPQFRQGNRARVTVRHLLAHTSGLPAGSSGRTLDAILSAPLAAAPGTRVVYSDVGMVALWAAAERAAGEPLPALLRRRVWEPLGMRDTRFRPGGACPSCAPTRSVAGYRGVVHDPIARRLGGATGNAGLFSTAHDLGRFAGMLAGGGELDGVRVLRPETVRELTRRQPGAGTRALGWDTGRAAVGEAHPVWHTGYTGTSLWIDPEHGTWAVLLTNRTYAATRANPLPGLRREVHAVVARASADIAPEPGRSPRTPALLAEPSPLGGGAAR